MATATSTDTKRLLETQLIEKAWKDPEFRKDVMRDPKTMLEKHLGRKLPDQLKIYIHEEDANTLHFSVPPAPASVSELSDQELEQVAGGTEWFIVMSVVATVAAAGTAVGTAAAGTKATGW